MASNADLKMKITLDGVTQTNASLTRISARFAGLSAAARVAGGSIALVGTGLAKLGTGTAALALTALSKSIKSVTLASTAMGIASTVAFKKALSYGAQMHKTASLLGVDAGQVDLLSQAFKENGAGAEMVAQSMAFMMRSISNGSKGFEKLGLSVAQLKGMTVVEQFEAIGNAIRGMTSQEDKVAAMMEIFGRSGSQLAQLMNNPNALGDAARTLGSEARILAEQAATFERVNTLIGNIGTKVRTMFTGIAAGLVSPLRGVLETLNSFDVASWGERIGQAIGEPLRAALQAFREGQLGTMLKDAFGLAVDYLQARLRFTFLDSGLVEAFGRSLQIAVAENLLKIPGVSQLTGLSQRDIENARNENEAELQSRTWEGTSYGKEILRRFDDLKTAYEGFAYRAPDYTVPPIAPLNLPDLPEMPDIGDSVAKAVNDGIAHSQYFHVGGYGANETPTRSPEYSFAKNSSEKATQTVNLLTQGNALLRQLAGASGSTSCTYA